MKEPFSENDPVFDLLGKSKNIEPRADFTQNVLRAIRQESPKAGLLQKLLGAWSENFGTARLVGALAVVASIALAIAWIALPSMPPDTLRLAHSPTHLSQEETLSSDSLPLLEEGVESDLETLEELDRLLAVQNTTDLSDSQIALLLY